MDLKMPSVKWRQFCLGLNMLKLQVADPYTYEHFIAKNASTKMIRKLNIIWVKFIW